MPAYPGDPVISITVKNEISVQGYNVLNICMGTHSGTHIDAPLHLIDKSNSVDELSCEKFLGMAYFIEILKSKNELINPADLEKFEIKENDILVIRTGWEENSYKANYFTGFPYFSVDCAKYLILKRIKAIGVDLPSVDGPETNAAFHKKILAEGIPIIEALVNLKQLVGKRMMFSALPIKIKNGDGAPVRAIAFEL
ncbi:MAG: cyclase family protein [Actinobacteria bacterium]|nr:cyclase family protein [Cyanobacteriota bacterium]MCL5771316.1 cyclase family protein [Actinomycetota bacterium]